nr:MAG TPA: hypothetical protein [Bacteriophage sp.]
MFTYGRLTSISEIISPLFLKTCSDYIFIFSITC